jgi:hypothetical protein
LKLIVSQKVMSAGPTTFFAFNLLEQRGLDAQVDAAV